jgi:soluble lytic murein transglycosylase
VYLDAVNNYPTSYDSYQALLVLVDNEIPVDELNRGIVDYYAGQYGVATAAFDRYLQSAPADPGTAHYYYGLALRSRGGNQDAIQQWDALIRTTGHRYWDAWSKSLYAVGIPGSIRAYDQRCRISSPRPSHPRAGSSYSTRTGRRTR